MLRSSEWGWIQPKPGGTSWANLSPTVWLVLAGMFVIWLFFRWQNRREAHGQEPLVRTAMLQNRQLGGGLRMFFFQYLVQAGLFFVVPLFLSVCLGLSALATGARLLPLSVTLLAAAVGEHREQELLARPDGLRRDRALRIARPARGIDWLRGIRVCASIIEDTLAVCPDSAAAAPPIGN